MIDKINEAALESGITAFITNSTERIETQLNRITDVADLPIMLVSWDLDTSLSFDEHGFMNNPSTKVVCLLMTKAEDTSKERMEFSANEMGALFQQFIQTLNINLSVSNKKNSASVTDAGYKLVPRHGAGKHSGILGRFTMLTEVAPCKK